MGTTSSKPSGTPIVIHGETPVQFSGNLVNTLTHTSETDGSRQKALELHIQSRVADELSRLEARESEILAGIDERLSREGAPKEELALDRNKVQAEIEALRKRLESIPKPHELDEDVKKAREAVVGCLRKNDTRPLDCWQEVEEFKSQARRMEKHFVVKTVGREY
ncbi:hypothetical protein FN846DRAFT_944925 [Sphaerosporella brunnea]|uniref:DUF1690 domain-containing protein n=1 Tax=Sphaerosporella brunnea TaxID=1250544 RepID=A0A5J5F012_9PEZI|nr:hypothetical protein FN846DRAFT_944925 [Sphaerosporella brunnea]